MEESSLVLRSAVTKILGVLELPPLEAFSPRSTSSNAITPEAVADQLLRSASTAGPRSHRAAGMAMTRENSPEPEPGNSDEAHVPPPMGSLYEVTKLRNIRNNPGGSRGAATLEDDLISKGKLSVNKAEALFSMFCRNLNHYTWGGIALRHEGLTAVRQSSTLLLVALLTVTSLHIPGDERIFDICYAEFTTLVCDSMFERYHTLDDIRALAIAAFWLSDVSCKYEWTGTCIVY